MNFPIERDPESGILLVSVFLNGRYRMVTVLDTGASHTIFDFTELVVTGFDLGNVIGIAEIETANGVVQTEIFEVQEITAFGITRKNFPIQVYDFLGHGVLSDFQGLLGMDFFESTKFCVDTVNNRVSVEHL